MTVGYNPKDFEPVSSPKPTVEGANETLSALMEEVNLQPGFEEPTITINPGANGPLSSRDSPPTLKPITDMPGPESDSDFSLNDPFKRVADRHRQSSSIKPFGQDINSTLYSLGEDYQNNADDEPDIKETKINSGELDLTSLLEDSDVNEGQLNEPEEDDEDDFDLNIGANFKKYAKFIWIGIGILLIVIFASSIFKNSKSKEVTVEVTEQDRSNETVVKGDVPESQINSYKRYGDISIVTAESFEPESNLYTDYLIIKKNMLLWDGTSIPLVTGETTKEKILVRIPIDIDTYNSLEDGQIITVYYNKIEVNSILYAVNIKLGEVLAE